MVPLGTTINMGGTALYDRAIGLDWAAGIPMAGLHMISVILTGIGLPQEELGLIIAVNQALKVCRNTVNVRSTPCGAAVAARTTAGKSAV